MSNILISFSTRYNKDALNMNLVTAFLLFLIHASLTLSKTIVFDRRKMDSTNQINPEENYFTTQMNPSPPNYETEKTKLQISFITEDNAVTQNPNLIDTRPIEIVRRLDPSDQLREKIPSTAIKQAARQTYILGDVDATSMRTTSEDMLQWLLKKKLPFPDPAPNQVGQSENGIMYPVTEPIWRFEGYDDSKSYNERIRDQNSDCEGQRMRCIEDTEYNQPVCVNDNSIPDYFNPQARMKGFSSFCVVEYRNCIKRYEITGRYYAASYNEDYLEFLHYGWCTQCNTAAFCYPA